MLHDCEPGQEAHISELRNFGEQRIPDLCRWRESPSFTAREKAALDLGELISGEGDEADCAASLQRARGHLNEAEIIGLVVAITSTTDYIYGIERALSATGLAKNCIK
jgi:alkylhydroperoxidase family enzyme